MYLHLKQCGDFKKKLHEKSRAIIHLRVHLPNMQLVYFFDDEEYKALERAALRNTMLTAWFALNRADFDGNRYLYADIPKHFVWKNNKWERRVQLGNRIVSRFYSVSPKDIERFNLRMLLFHVPRAKSFEELRIYEGIVRTFLKRRIVLGICWKTMLRSFLGTMTPPHALSAVDRLFRDLMCLDVTFGGKVFVLGCDRRYILPVAVHANKTAIVETCLKNSPL
ncbi:ATP-dependent DNA helicase [Trichonephila clavipes]|uniref:ATP-dependent DNA helicase n=1 Tax=Trichonephila clavipes TaxID=2585209 RepID=A0A8X6VNY4_TRICX|nr:ATP-dependent DNA helicase [Trichonephila clavipes]